MAHAHSHNHTHANGQHHDHPAQHSHSAHQHGRDASQRTLLLVLALTFGYMLAEVIGGYLANSLALLSDAGHMFTDVAALALSFFAVRFAARPATPSKTYGFYRLEILAALANGVALIVLSLLICVEAYRRLREPQSVNAWTLIVISVGGLLVNLVSAKLLAHDQHDNLNVRGAFLHVLGDLLGSVAAIAAGLLIAWRGWQWADPVFSVVISVLIIFNAWRLAREAVNVLLEGAPAHINPKAVEQALLAIPGVQAVHDMHIWTLTSGRHIITAHIVVRDCRESTRILGELRALLAKEFALDHATLQLEEPAQLVNIEARNKQQA
jgi:cobalt-zinc-cadmium efflux system protein